MKFILYIILLFDIQTITFCQEKSINYFESDINFFIMSTKLYSNNKLTKTSKKTIKKGNLIFNYKCLNIYHTPATKAIYTNLQSEIARNIKPQNMPNIDCYFLMCGIISADGKLLYVGIVRGQGYPYDFEVINAVKKTNSWIPGTYGGVKVNSLVFFSYRHILY